jgi:hypothetical protein
LKNTNNWTARNQTSEDTGSQVHNPGNHGGENRRCLLSLIIPSVKVNWRMKLVITKCCKFRDGLTPMVPIVEKVIAGRFLNPGSVGHFSQTELLSDLLERGLDIWEESPLLSVS